MDHRPDYHSVLLLRREQLGRKRLRLQQRLRRLLLTRHDIRRRNQKYPLSAARRSGVLLCPAQTHYKEPAQSEHFPDRTWFRRRPCGRAAVRTALSWKRKMLGWWRDWVYSNMTPSLL